MANARPGISSATYEGDGFVALSDDEPDQLNLTLFAIVTDLIELLESLEVHKVVPKRHERDLHVLNPANEIGIIGAGQDQPVKQAPFRQNGRKHNVVGCSAGLIIRGGEKNVLPEQTGAIFHALKDSSVKGIQKVPVAEDEANYLRMLAVNSACLGVGSEPKPLNGRQNPVAGGASDFLPSV